MDPKIQLQLTVEELNFIVGLIMQRPMGEVEALILNLRGQVNKQFEADEDPLPFEPHAEITD